MLARKVKDLISSWGGKGGQMDLLYTSLKYTLARVMGAVKDDDGYAQWFYKLYTGKQLNLEHPTYFDEKVWWLKLHNRDPLLTRCSDKHLARGYVEECGLAEILIPQLGVYADPDEIDFSQFQEEVVVKCNHNSGGLFFYDPHNPPSAKELNFAKKRLRYILRHNQYVLSHEWNYKNIPPKIIVDKVIKNKKGEYPTDYKFMCFDGEPKLLFLDLGLINNDQSYNHSYPRNIYDMDFNLLPVHETRPNADYPVEKPENFEKMVEVARKLSQPFPFCRCDLYNVDGKVYFGELTFYHGGGCNNIQPEEWDRKIASWIDLNNPKIKLEESGR